LNELNGVAGRFVEELEGAAGTSARLDNPTHLLVSGRRPILFRQSKLLAETTADLRHALDKGRERGWMDVLINKLEHLERGQQPWQKGFNTS
jgi:hypothetical protein